MKNRYSLCLASLFLAGIFTGCSDAQSVAVNNSGDTIINGAVVETGKRIEIPADVTPVRVWLCPNNGSYVFDDENCVEKKNPARDLQVKVRERFSHYSILKIEQTREYFGRETWTVFYVYLKHGSS